MVSVDSCLPLAAARSNELVGKPESTSFGKLNRGLKTEKGAKCVPFVKGREYVALLQ